MMTESVISPYLPKCLINWAAKHETQPKQVKKPIHKATNNHDSKGITTLK